MYATEKKAGALNSAPASASAEDDEGPLEPPLSPPVENPGRVEWEVDNCRRLRPQDRHQQNEDANRPKKLTPLSARWREEERCSRKRRLASFDQVDCRRSSARGKQFILLPDHHHHHHHQEKETESLPGVPREEYQQQRRQKDEAHRRRISARRNSLVDEVHVVKVIGGERVPILLYEDVDSAKEANGFSPSGNDLGRRCDDRSVASNEAAAPLQQNERRATPPSSPSTEDGVQAAPRNTGAPASVKDMLLKSRDRGKRGDRINSEKKVCIYLLECLRR